MKRCFMAFFCYFCHSKGDFFWGTIRLTLASDGFGVRRSKAGKPWSTWRGFGYPPNTRHLIRTEATYKPIGCSLLVEGTTVEGMAEQRYFERLSLEETEYGTVEFWLDQALESPRADEKTPPAC